MTDTYDPAGEAPASMFDMLQGVLARDSTREVKANPTRAFGAAMEVFSDTGTQTLSGSAPDFGLAQEPSPFSRMFSSKFGNEAVSRVGNEEKALHAIQHLSTELVAEALRLSDQITAEDRLLLSSAPGPDGAPVPIVVMLTDREGAQDGTLQSDNLSLPHDMMQRVLFSMSDSLPRDRIDSPRGASYGVLERALKTEVDMAELMMIAQPEVISFKRPEMIDLSAPENCLRVGRGNEISSTGVLCTDGNGQLGITACYHGTGDEGTEVTVNGHPLSVTMANPVQDLVFIALDDLSLVPALRAVDGLREEDDLAPALREPFTFDGIINAHTQTFAQSSDPWLFNPDPYAQIRFQTNRDTDKGDSGSALLDRHQKLCGFAFRMTPYGYEPGFTDWIWAPNALASLNLSLYQN